MKNSSPSVRINPFEAPRASLEVEPEQNEIAENLYDAVASQRIVAFLVDLIGFTFAGFLLGALGVITGTITESTSEFVYNCISWLAMILYYVTLEYTFNRTFGKMVAGTRVCARNGSRPSFGAIVIRTLSRFVPFEALSVLGGRSMWHDDWSKTRTVSTRKPKWAEVMD